uniref:(northern house mosquito) hypothetical protein n=1 Tax=Culex pipiens TaxID=7175 RepID=A0A8D8MIV0_CULPI
MFRRRSHNKHTATKYNKATLQYNSENNSLESYHQQINTATNIADNTTFNHIDDNCPIRHKINHEFVRLLPEPVWPSKHDTGDLQTVQNDFCFPCSHPVVVFVNGGT